MARQWQHRRQADRPTSERPVGCLNRGASALTSASLVFWSAEHRAEADPGSADVLACGGPLGPRARPAVPHPAGQPPPPGPSACASARCVEVLCLMPFLFRRATCRKGTWAWSTRRASPRSTTTTARCGCSPAACSSLRTEQEGPSLREKWCVFVCLRAQFLLGWPVCLLCRSLGLFWLAVCVPHLHFESSCSRACWPDTSR